MKYEFKYKIGQIVYLVTDEDQLPRLVTGINIRQNSITYAISHSTDESFHYDFELSTEKNIITLTKYN